MIKAGSKGSFNKLVQQTVCLGLQLYKGEELLASGDKLLNCQMPLRNLESCTITDLLWHEAHGVPLSGYWESRGIISKSYVDGLSPLQFFIHAIASRYGIQRAGVEEPNALLNNLLLFMRDLHVGYDGTIRDLQGRHIIQFQYGGLRVGSETPQAPAGEAVGVLAATAIAEPAYQLKLDSPHMIGAKEIGPLQLLKESLRSHATMQSVDRRILLRLPPGLCNRQNGQERGAIKVKEHLKAVTLDRVTLTTIIEYQKVKSKGRGIGMTKRSSPWVGHIHLSEEELRQEQISVAMILHRLERKFSAKEAFHCLIFSSSDKCHLTPPSTEVEKLGPCIRFFSDLPSSVASYDDKEYEEHMSTVLESMKNIMLPIILQTTVKGDERIQSVCITWEDSAWDPSSTVICSSGRQWKPMKGELVVAVSIRNAGCRTWGKAWEIVKEACLPIMETLDWQRCMPYSIQEINRSLGVEAAYQVLLQRLRLAADGMGKPIQLEHLKLIADRMAYSGEFNGSTFAGYKKFCRSTSISTPFAKAAFRDSKNMFVEAAQEGACESMKGAMTACVWGKNALVGTGADFKLLWQERVAADSCLQSQKGVDLHDYLSGLSSRPVTHTCPGTSSASMPDLDYHSEVSDALCQSPSGTTESSPVLDHRDSEEEGHHSEADADRMVKMLFPSRCDAGLVPGPIEMLIERGFRSASCESLALGVRSTPHVSLGSKVFAADRRCSLSAAVPMKRRKTTMNSHDVTEVGKKNSKRRVSGWDVKVGHVRTPVSERLGRQNCATPASPPHGVEETTILQEPCSSLQVCNAPELRPGTPEESCSSFHTPTATLEACSGSSSPCSSFSEHPGKAAPCERSKLETIGWPSLSSAHVQSSTGATCGNSLTGKTFQATNDRASPASCDQSTPPHFGPSIRSSQSEVECEKPVTEEAIHRLSPFLQPLSGLMSKQKLQLSVNLSDVSSNRKPRRDASHAVPSRVHLRQSEEWESLASLVRTVQHILHSRYQVGERLVAEHQRLILDKVLCYHPDSAAKRGCGVHYIKVDHHANHPTSRCFFVVRKDGSVSDFSYHKCLKGLASTKGSSFSLRYDAEFGSNRGRGERCEDFAETNCIDVVRSFPPEGDEPVQAKPAS